MDFADREDQNSDFDENLDDGHCKPECEIGDIEGCVGATRKVVVDCVAWIADLNDAGSDTPGGADGNKDDGGIAQVGGEEETTIEKENGNLDESDDRKVKDAVDVDILELD